MAIFQDTRNLDRQERYVGMNKVTGSDKIALSMLGYKDTGERNLWGKMGLMSPLSRLTAKRLAGGTDTAKVLKETDDEYWSTQLSKGKFALEAGKLAIGLGVGGGGAGSALTGAAGTQAGTSVATDVASSVGTGQGSALLQGTLKDQGSKIAQDFVEQKANDAISGKTDSQLLKEIDEENEDGTLNLDAYRKRGFNLGLEDEDYLEDDEANDGLLDKDSSDNERLKKVLGYVPMVGGVAKSGLELIASQRNLTKESEIEADKFKNKTAKDSEFNLL